MENKGKVLQKAKNIFENLKTDPDNVLFSEEKRDKLLLKKLKKSSYAKDHLLLKLINLAEQKINDESKPPTRVDYVEKREIDRSTLYSFDGPFHLVHAGVGNLEFLGKGAATPRYVLLVVDLYSSNVYVYPMRSRNQILQKLNQFYDEIKDKRNKKKTMCLEVDNEFQQAKIKDLNNHYNVEMFTATVRGAKSICSETKNKNSRAELEN